MTIVTRASKGSALTWEEMDTNFLTLLDASSIHAATEKTVPEDSDEFLLLDNDTSFGVKKTTWADKKATLKTYFDTLYQTVGSYLTTADLGVSVQAYSPLLSSISAGTTALSFRNKIINGKMDVRQRGDVFLPVTANTYTLDRWVYGAVSTSAVLNLAANTDAPSSGEFRVSLRTEVTTADASIASGDIVHISQYIEGYNVRELIGKSFTLSFWARSAKAGTHCVSFRNSGSDRSYVSEYQINTINTWEYKTVTVPAGLITAGTWDWTNGSGIRVGWALAAGSTYQTTKDTWQIGNYLSTANQVNCLDTIGNIFAITGVQLEAGSVATPFEHRPIGTELALCQRYFQTIGRMFGWSLSDTQMVFNHTFPTTMRNTPTLVVVNATPAGESPIGVSGRTSSGISPSLGTSSASQAQIYMNGFSGMTAQQSALVNSCVTLSAEL